MQRKLTVILSADVVGYSGMMERDEAGTLRRLMENRAQLFDPHVAVHGGRIFKLMGDGVLIEFSSATAAVTCAFEIQTAMAKAEPDLPEHERLRYRIGINLGDVIVEGDDIYGEGVNVATRLQALAEVGGIALSRNVAEQAAGKAPAEFDDIGPHMVKNIERPVHVFAVRMGAATALPPSAPSPSPGAARTTDTTRKPTVCVLPFANLSGDAEQEYFSDGISEDIIVDLGKVSALSVVSRNTAFSFKGKALGLNQIARQLRVSHLLEGSVRKSGLRVRINAQLIDGRNDEQVWGERWDRDLTDIFALQDEISEAIVAALKIKLLPEEKRAIEQRGTANAEAYEIYLMARKYRVMANLTDARKAEMVIRLAKRAIELDPKYARAWAMLAVAQRMLGYSGHSGDNGLEAAERALALDASLAEAHAAKIGVFVSRQDYAQARAALADALPLDPESYELNQEAARLAYLEHRWADAIRHWEIVARVAEDNFSSVGMLMSCYAALNDQAGLKSAAERTLTRAERAVAADPDNGSALSLGIGAMAHLGQTDRAREWAARAMLLDPDNLNMRYNIACAFILDLDDVDTGLDILEPAFAQFGRDRLAHAKADPDFERVRDHPRFQAMIAAAEARLGQG